MSIIPINPGELIALGAIWPPVCGVILGLRFYSRRKQNAKFGLDDWLMVPAFVLLTGMAVVVLSGVGLHVLGYPTPKAPPGKAASHEQQTTQKLLWIFELLQILALSCVKFSVLFFYRRIFVVNNTDPFAILTIVLGVIVLLWMLGFFLVWVFICGATPNAYWISFATEAAKCPESGELHNAYAISDFITDVLILLAPIHPIAKLHVSLEQKLALIGIFMLGLLTVAASATRLAVYQKATAAKFNPHAHVDSDLTSSIGMYWSLLESSLGFCAACLPSIYTIVVSKGIQSIIRSARSLASLGSHTSVVSGSKSTPNTKPSSETTPYSTNDHQWTKLPDDKTATLTSFVVQNSERLDNDEIELQSLHEHNKIKMSKTFDMTDNAA